MSSLGLEGHLVELGSDPENWLPSLSPSMQAVERILSDIVSTRLPVLLVGEPGVGKDAIARRIHDQSATMPGGFLKVDCAKASAEALGNLLERLVKTNGHRPAPATLFLDGIGALTAECQIRLLSALPDKPSSPPRENGHWPVRLVSATNRNLEEQLGAGRFQEELYFRICGLCLRIPPLRHRKEDILPLLGFFLARFAGRFETAQPKLGAGTSAWALEHSWPGNVRELEHFARNVVLLGGDGPAMAAFQRAAEAVPDAPAKAATTSLKEVARAASRQAEQELILKTLARTRWNRKRAAQELRISYKALLYKLKEISVEESLD